MLSGILDDPRQPYFVRSAAAWSLSRVGTQAATQRLVQAFSDIDRSIREEALDGIVSIGGDAVPALLAGLRGTEMDVAAGCAEALRQQPQLPPDALPRLAEELRRPDPAPWAIWLLGHLPRERVAITIAGIQYSAPQLHYAISLLWSFVESWIARRWEVYPGSGSSTSDNAHGA